MSGSGHHGSESWIVRPMWPPKLSPEGCRIVYRPDPDLQPRLETEVALWLEGALATKLWWPSAPLMLPETISVQTIETRISSFVIGDPAVGEAPARPVVVAAAGRVTGKVRFAPAPYITQCFA